MRTIAENANDFVDLRTADGGNCVYVDKTDYFHRLVTAGSKTRQLVDAGYEEVLKGRGA